MGAGDLLPVVDVDEVKARSDDVGEADARSPERLADELEAEPCLLVGALRRVGLCRDRRRAGHVDPPPATTAREKPTTGSYGECPGMRRRSTRLVSPAVEALRQIESWPAEHGAAGVATAQGVVAGHGDAEHGSAGAR